MPTLSQKYSVNRSQIVTAIESHNEYQISDHLESLTVGIESLDDDLIVGTEGFGDIASGIGKWFSRIVNNKTLEEPERLLDANTKKLIESTLFNPKWREIQKFKTGVKISAEGISERLTLNNNKSSANYINGIRKNLKEMTTFAQNLAKAIEQHSDQVIEIDKQAKRDWGNANGTDAKLAVIEQALVKLKQLQHPSDFYLNYKIECIGSLVPKLNNKHCFYEIKETAVNIREIDPITEEDFNLACDLFKELWDSFVLEKTDSMWSIISDKVEYVPLSVGHKFWDQIKKETNEGKLWSSYALSCVQSYQEELVLHSSLFGKFYHNAMRGLIVFISRSIK